MLLNVLILLLSEGKPIPTELRKDEAELRKLLAYDEKEQDGKSRTQYMLKEAQNREK